MLAELAGAVVLFAIPLEESSGLAVDGDRLYTVEDSGGPREVVVLDRSGTRTGTVEVDAENVDWEDLALHEGDLLVADIGDNRARREAVQVHRVPAAGGPTTTYRFTYEDGPRDAEGMVVRDGRVLVVSKELLGAGLYAAPLQDGAVLRRVAGVPVVLATGAALSPDGVLGVRDYGGLSEWRLGEDLAASLAVPPVRSALPEVEQGEAVAYDGPDAVLTTSEGTGSPVHRLTRLALAAGPAAEQPAPERPPPGRLLVAGGLAVAAAVLGALLARRRRRP